MDKRARRHALAKHLPAVFKDATGVEHLPGAVQALRWLVHMAYGQEASLWDAVHRVNQSGLIPESANLNPLHHKVFIEACKLLQISEPSHFTLRPINSPAVLLFWRCIMVILNSCSPDQQQQFYHFQPSEDPSKEDKMVEEASDSELPSDLEEFILVDEADSDQDESTVVANTSLPQVFDAHFHLDRSLRAVWGRSGGRTVEELLQYSFSSDVSYKPAIKVDVVGGIIVYSEPKSYPEVNFTLQGPWKVAIGVHPKHYDTLTVEKTMKMQQLLEHPKVVALGECGLDRTIAPSQWCRQEEVFVRLLKLTKVEQPLVLHLRGPRGDTYSSDVHGRCLMLMEDICDPEQKIHVHCFMGRADVVRTWLRKFPNTYFGVTAAVRAFDHEQLEGLQAIPHNKLLLETDAPYFPLGGAIVSTPAYLGEVAAYLSVHLNMRPPELMRTTVMNARKLYGC
ncbi:uncharacterized metal-dependent hydrolase YabD-like [Saccostrea cucullata]|uniref:uncharacterized metal-dependent hydrolase YabD-like n=2 Tax=Saccostrea cuccullata TaxID=36930 RepID=UPI002ED6614F